MRKRAMLLAALLLLPAGPGLAQGSAVVNANSHVDGVTVYPDRAMVRRVARVELPAGFHKVRFPKLARDLMADSLRVGGEGPGGAILHGFDLRTSFLGASPAKDVAALETQLNGLNDKDRALNDEKAVHQRQLETLVETAEKSAGGLSAQLASGKANLKTWQELLGFLKSQQQAEAKAIQGIDQKKRSLATQITGVRQKLQKLRGFRREEIYQCDVSVETQRAGMLDLTLEYVIPGASWTPAYDARLDARGERLDWRYYGVVRQSTGEDWNDVALRLSTARPASGSQPPMLEGWFLSLWQPAPPPAPVMVPGRAYGAAQNVFNQRRSRDLASEAEVPAPQPAAEPVAVVADQGSSVTLEVPRRVDIPSDGEPHQTPIGAIALKPKTAYRVVPRVSTEAFLEAEALHPGPWPLLAGPVKSFVGKDYVGTSPLREDISPNQRFNLAMGVDRSMQVKRTRLSKNVGEGGLIGRHGFAEYRYEITITNFKAAAQPVTVIEPVPQATQDVIKVIMNPSSHPYDGSSPVGQARWKLTVQPGEKKVLQWGYRVEWPQGQMPAGLE